MSNQARVIFTCVYLLVGLGLVMTYSASAVFAGQLYGNPQYFLIRQMIYAGIGTAVLFAAARLPFAFWKRHARALMLLAIAFLMLVFVPVIGHSAGGARRWLRLGFFHFQPAEFAKIAVCLYLADYLYRKRQYIKKGKILIFLPPLILVVIICGLTLLQPDLGSTAYIFLMAAILFFLAGIRLRYVLGAVMVFLPLLYFAVLRVPYRASRVTAYLNPWQDPQGSGFQMIQSLIAFSLGGVKGAGLGASTQKLFYLPSAHNDFIFSILAEELGLAGVLFVLVLYGAIFISGIQMAENAAHDDEKLVILSLVFLIVLQALIHMLVTTGLVPTKGLPLPFVSYGGTSIVFNLMAVGLLLGLDRASAASWSK